MTITSRDVTAADHLPECLFVERDGWVQRPCICDQLRACEQRVRGKEPADERAERLIEAVGTGITYGAERAWDWALDAARQAVESSCGWHPRGRCVECTAAVAAIDALRGEQPPPLPPSVGVPTKPMWPLRGES